MVEVTCISVSNYAHALTRGKRYTVVATDEKGQIRLRGDNNRTRWYPGGIFDFENRPVPMMVSFTIDDPIEDDYFVEVTVTLSTGEQRYCVFVTPYTLANYGGQTIIAGRQIRLHYGNANLIIVSELDAELIEAILRVIDSQNELMECTTQMRCAEEE